ncbi:MAG: nuclear transport factor 2 family protein [Alphaproteobacteria bacterium]|nr:nuclear transport factor 2 family protein [Alphaproteobacteria bacterium]
MVATADALATHCREGTTDMALEKLYADDCVSVEAALGPGQASRETVGRDGIKSKHEWWYSQHEIHDQKVEGPYLHGDDKFGLIFEIDVTNKEMGMRMQMREFGLYQVDAAGKITREEFFYIA